MADSAKGIKANHKYVAHRNGAGYTTFNSETGIYHSLLETYDLITNHNAKIYKSTGEDYTATMLERAAKWHAKVQLAEERKRKKQEAEEARLNSGGYFCDCALSSKYKDPEDVPLNLTEEEIDEIADTTRVPVSDTKDCLYCGYAAIYYSIDPALNRGRHE